MKNAIYGLLLVFATTALFAQTKPTIEWADIPAGTFTMGSPTSEVDRRDDETQHQVTLSAFKMSKYEVTFEQYNLFCEATGRSKPDDHGWGRGKRPVINVSWPMLSPLPNGWVATYPPKPSGNMQQGQVPQHHLIQETI